MKKSILLGSMLGLALVASGCQNRASREGSREQAAGTPAGEREPVAGTEEGAQRQLPYDTHEGVEGKQPVAGGRAVGSLISSVKNELGDDWTVIEQSPGSYVATRNKPAKADEKLGQKVQDHVRDLQKNNTGLSANYQGGDQIMLRGQAKTCDDVSSAVDKFSGVDGINRISFQVTCPDELKERQEQRQER